MSNDSRPFFTERPPEEVGDPTTLARLLTEEKVAVPAYLRQSPMPDLGSEDLAIGRYTSPEFFRLEAQRLWPKVWQLVTREENIPNPGDHVVYDICDESIVVIRGDDGQIRGFVNSCLHRGRALRTSSGCVSQLRCPFHGFAWDLRGGMKTLPCVWDFPQLKREEMSLPQVRIETWGGFVFLNFDAQAPSLREYLGVLPEHLERFSLDKCFTVIHVQKRVPCNWKAGQEAFVEALHVKGTHPAIMTYTGDVDSQYDLYGDHICRMITPFTVPSPNIEGVSQQRIVQDIINMQPGNQAVPEIPPGVSAREFIGERHRALFSAAIGEDLKDATWAELVDAMLYGVFPNTQIWGGWYGNIVYRFIPDGNDPDSSLFDIRILARVPDGTPRPPAAPLRRLGDDESFATVQEWGGLGEVFDQDFRNLRAMTKGMKASHKRAVSLANYQESRIRHMHRTLDRYLGLES